MSEITGVQPLPVIFKPSGHIDRDRTNSMREAAAGRALMIEWWGDEPSTPEEERLMRKEYLAAFKTRLVEEARARREAALSARGRAM